MKPKKEIAYMSAVAKDIIGLKLEPKMTLRQMEGKFFRIMRKYGIRRGTKNKGQAGVLMSNPEWVICQELFLERVQDCLQWMFLDFSRTPKDLQHY